MSLTDWLVLLLTLILIILYGMYKGRGQKDAKSYLLANQELPWYVVLLGIMATQASAITFLSAPGQAYTDGMRFVQYYFGLPLAMIVISVTFIPIFQRLKVYTAYEYLENRFDKKTRILTSFLFLMSRGLSTGISIYAPSIILSTILGWNIYITNILTGGLLLLYTYSGGAKAIAHTQKLQFLIILGSMAFAGYLLIKQMPEGVTFNDALFIAGKSGKLNVITTDFDLNDRYNIWSGIIGGFFLALSYFGTDQSQVGRYISAKNVRTGRIGLLLNGLIKIPMQFSILLIGALLFAFFALKPAPVYFNERSYNILEERHPEVASKFNQEHNVLQEKQIAISNQLLQERDAGSENIDQTVADYKAVQTKIRDLHSTVENTINESGISIEKTDTNYIFLYFVQNTLPKGMIGLLFAVIFLASWGSISAALNSLASSSYKDIQMRLRYQDHDDKKQLLHSRLHTLFWAIFSIGVAMFATQMGSLIEAVNILGSLFYGPILGIFLVAFYYKKINGHNMFISAILAELSIILIYNLDLISFLWLNVIGAAAVFFFCFLISFFQKSNQGLED